MLSLKKKSSKICLPSRIAVFGLGMVSALASAAVFAETLTLYSARSEALLKPILAAYTRETGVQVLLFNDKNPILLERLRAEGPSTSADLLMTVDAGNLWQASQQQLLRPIQSPVLEAEIPAKLRDPERRWYGLSVRARTIFYNKRLVQPAQLSTYEALATPRWKGKLCLRSASKVYNQSLVATLIQRIGPDKTEAVVRGWVANLAAPVFNEDTKLLEAIAAGQCQVGIANTYYYGRLKAKQPNSDVKLFWANQRENGVHINISGAGVTRYAKNPAGAQRLLEWLASAKAQQLFAESNYEFPVNATTPAAPLVQQWGLFRQDDLNVAVAGRLQSQAVQLMDRAGYY